MEYDAEDGGGRLGYMRRWLGGLIILAGLTRLALEAWTWIQVDPVVQGAFGGGMVAALATALGTVPVIFSRRMSDRLQDCLLGFGAGVMLAAVAFSLILPGLEVARESNAFGSSRWGAGAVVGMAVLLGAAALMLLDRLMPHEHFIKGREGGEALRLRRMWLFVAAIALHNIPEGMAIGVAFAANEGMRAQALATGIAIQDLPEGMVVAVALLAVGYSRWRAIAIGMASGLVEPIGAVLAAGVTGHLLFLLPWGLGFAAGAMLFVVSHEIIPESHRKGHEQFATAGLMMGFVLMMMLDTALS